MTLRCLFAVLAALLLLAGCGGAPTPEDVADAGADAEPTEAGEPTAASRAETDEGEMAEAEETATDEGDAEGEDEAGGSILVYTSVPEPIIDDLVSAFTEVNPAIDVEVFRGTTGDVSARIATEQQAGAFQADLIWVAEPSAYEGFKRDDLLAQYSPPDPDAFPPDYVDPDGFYVAGRVINMVVAWNTEQVPDGLRDWGQLTEGELRTAFPGPGSGSALAAIKALTAQIDEDYFATFAEAGGVQVSANGAARDGIVSGEYDAVGVLDYMVREAQADGSPVDFVYPDSGTVVIPSPLAITSTASNPEGAEAFADFMLSPEGQQIVVDVGGFYPARTDVDPPEGQPSLDEIEVLTVDWQALVDETADIDTRWAEIFGS